MAKLRLLTFVLLTVAAVPSSAGELEDRRAIEQHVAALFASEKFSELDGMADEYRTTETRTSSGLWKLTLFYAGIHGNSSIKAPKYWDDIEAKALRWTAQSPTSPAAHNVYAYLLINRAWMHRGSGWAHEVKPEAWAPFAHHLKRSREYLMQRRAIADADPRWYELMLMIARAENWDRNRFDQLVDEAVLRYPYFYQIYFAAIDYLVPKWHGNREEVEKFANFAVEKTRGRESNGMYARVYWYASQTQYTTRLFTDSAVAWKRMSVGVDDVLARYPDQWNMNNFAAFACLAGDREKTRELIARIEGRPIPSAWHGSIKWFDSCKAWADRLGNG
ncbi:cytoplasmic protein [Sulfurifustis variabilis]|uniref:Cytoplasmic protein n=1 Tax=Sulfurifustis variabilis TaxID=1675686 RepID=A0A1B4V0E4_9GAMM|nr:DUF4034 domain-containing protein [Sulfurifustis variabilis]BAU46909.1 cytoplasmic protein [Sulfurifustis variabilis]